MHGRHYFRAVAVAALAALVATATTSSPTAIAESPSAAETRLSAAIDGILADARLDGAQAGVVVADATTGARLYQRHGERRLVPASNTKLLTSAAALDLLGPGHRFTTDVRIDGDKRGEVLAGDLYLRGGGDPTMLAADYDALAAQVASAGVRVVSGNLVADDTRYDTTRLGPDWTWDDEPYYYAAQVSALTVAPDTDYDAGTVIVTTAPGAHPGERPRITLTPSTGYVRVDNRATTVASGGSGISVERAHGTNTIVVTGQLAVDRAPTREWVTVWEPTGYAADVFRAALGRHGVRVVGDTVLGRAAPPDAAPVARHDSMPLAELLTPFLKLSNNGHAEVLTKEIGRVVAGSGTWSAGLAAISRYAAGAGVETGTLRQRDGSGLSRRNLVPPAEFVDLLVAVRDEPWFATWYAALPVAGDPDRLVGGTLRSRMRGTPAAGNVHAKTGSLTGVSSLSGYVTDADGRLLAFSVVLNNYLASSVKSLEDQIAVALASYQEGVGALHQSTQPQPDVPGPTGHIECSWHKPTPC